MRTHGALALAQWGIGTGTAQEEAAQESQELRELHVAACVCEQPGLCSQIHSGAAVGAAPSKLRRRRV
eukprot:7371936-Alexandrium_andersonii.AAC.1